MHLAQRWTYFGVHVLRSMWLRLSTEGCTRDHQLASLAGDKAFMLRLDGVPKDESSASAGDAPRRRGRSVPAFRKMRVLIDDRRVFAGMELALVNDIAEIGAVLQADARLVLRARRH